MPETTLKTEFITAAFNNQVEYLRYLGNIDLRIFFGYIALQLVLAGWLSKLTAAVFAAKLGFFLIEVGYPFDSGDHNILWLAIGGPRKGLPIAPRFQACDGHGACVILDRPETQPRGPIACRPASGAPGCILGAVCWRPWIDQTTTPRGYLSQVDTPF